MDRQKVCIEALREYYTIYHDTYNRATITNIPKDKTETLLATVMNVIGELLDFEARP